MPRKMPGKVLTLLQVSAGAVSSPHLWLSE